jgi:hypothetical protein
MLVSPRVQYNLIGVDLNQIKKNQHGHMQWNDSYFIAADNGILSMLSQKNCSQNSSD